MKPLLTLSWLFLAAPWTIALDPFFPPEEWNEYQKRIIKGREYEKPVWQRPSPGTSPAVAIQTLILPEIEIKDATIEAAFDEWKQACQRCGVKVGVFLEPAVLRNRPVITHSAKNETAARALSFIENLSFARVKLVNDHFLAGTSNNLDPHELHHRVWVLSEHAVRLLGFHQATASNGSWCDADALLKQNGAAVPQGTYADYNCELRSLVAINTSVTLDAISELIEDTEGQVTIRKFKDQGVVQMDSYSLEVRPHPLKKENAAKISARFKDRDGRLVPFAANANTWAKFRGFVTPVGSAAWLDVETSTLWLRSKPDALTGFTTALKNAESPQ